MRSPIIVNAVGVVMYNSNKFVTQNYLDSLDKSDTAANDEASMSSGMSSGRGRGRGDMSMGKGRGRGDMSMGRGRGRGRGG